MMGWDVATAYRSGSQQTRVVTEAWGAENLYCSNCSSDSLSRLSNNAKASDFACPSCGFEYQLKGQKSPIRSTITDGAYGAMMEVIRSDKAPSYFFMHYDLATWSIQNLLLIPNFAFPVSAVIKRKPLSSTARRAGWVGCNFALDRIPLDARIDVVKNRTVTPASDVRKRFKKLKPMQEMSVDLRGWALDVLNIVRRLGKQEFSNADVYAFERELAELHPDNQHIKDKIRQKLQVLRDAGFLDHVGRNEWRVV